MNAFIAISSSQLIATSSVECSLCKPLHDAYRLNTCLLTNIVLLYCCLGDKKGILSVKPVPVGLKFS